ncbi:DUF1382 family protein [Klebsiella variicola]|nr:DUF1382 family protein [Klebsiella variicola]TXW15880.1 DUF1382 family protein [Klebsiella variicola]
MTTGRRPLTAAPFPVATEEEFQALSAELSRKLEQMAVEAEKSEGGAA